MNKPSYTPGPWGKDSRGDLRGADGTQVSVWDSGISWRNRSAVTEANARLIAAAPDMAEALRDVMNTFIGERKFADPEMTAIVDRAHAALQKAGLL